MYRNRIEKVTAAIAFIEAHLTQKLDLDAVAGAVHYSKYHLHRVFAETVGLTIHDYVQRRRLTESAKLLVFSEKPIVEIAAIAGYETQQAFTNIFTAMYKQAPSQYRCNEKFYALQLKFCLEGEYEMLDSNEEIAWNIAFAREEDIPAWMNLVRLVIDGFPHLQEEEYRGELKRYIERRQALIAMDGTAAAGVMLFSYQTGSIDFMEIGQAKNIEPMERHGEPPRVTACADLLAALQKIRQIINAFLQSGEGSLGIILKTNRAAQTLYAQLASEYDLQLISPDSTRFVSGISVASIQMSKGLEFDEVLIADADEETYRTAYDRGLLYIACTRAMHRLSLLHTGRRSMLIPDQGGAG